MEIVCKMPSKHCKTQTFLQPSRESRHLFGRIQMWRVLLRNLSLSLVSPGWKGITNPTIPEKRQVRSWRRLEFIWRNCSFLFGVDVEGWSLKHISQRKLLAWHFVVSIWDKSSQEKSPPSERVDPHGVSRNRKTCIAPFFSWMILRMSVVWLFRDIISCVVLFCQKLNYKT